MKMRLKQCKIVKNILTYYIGAIKKGYWFGNEIIITIKLKIIYIMACERYNLNVKDVDVFFVLWLEKLMQSEGKEN